jgi:hypothetical protein
MSGDLKGPARTEVASRLQFRDQTRDPCRSPKLQVVQLTAFGATGAKWDNATLDLLLKEPQELVKVNKMSAHHLLDERQSELI